MGFDMPTAVSVKVLEQAMHGTEPCGVLDFEQVVEDRVSKGSAKFYKLKVSEEQSARGVALRAWSTNSSDRLKLLLFDRHGEPRWQVNSSVCTQSKLSE